MREDTKGNKRKRKIGHYEEKLKDIDEKGGQENKCQDLLKRVKN